MVAQDPQTQQACPSPGAPAALALPATLAPGALVLVLRCVHCAPTQASTVLCGGCGAALVSPLDGPYVATASAILDWVILIHDMLKEQQAQEVAP
jgi:hypothetical protein